MKVLFVFFGDDYHGGTAYSTFTLARELVKRGHEVHAFVRVTHEAALSQDLESCGVIIHDGRTAIEVHPMSKQALHMRVIRKWLEWARRFHTLPKAEHEIEHIIGTNMIDLVAISSGAIVNGAKAAHKMAIPYVWHAREFMQEDHRLEYYPWSHAYEFMNKAASIICVSWAVANKMRGICPDTRIEVAYNGIDQSIFTSKGRIDATEEGSARLMFSGGINPSKGTYLLLDALAKIKDAVDITLDIFGAEGVNQGSRAKDLQAYCNRLGLTDIVHYRGLTNTIAVELRRHDIQIVASQAEAFGRVTAEAMACGCVVVGSNSGGTPELLADDRGYLFEPNDADSLAEVLLYAIQHPKERKTVATQAEIFVRENLSVNAYVDKVEAVYMLATS